MRAILTTVLTLSLALPLLSAESPQLAYSRRFFEVTDQPLEKAETKVVPVNPNETKGTVSVIFWTSERGAVVSARALGDGPADLQKAAVEAIYKWKFKPTSVNGQTVQIGTAVVIDFSQSPAVVRSSKAISI